MLIDISSNQSFLTRLLTDTSLSWQSLMSIEQYTIGTDVAALEIAPPNYLLLAIV